MNTPAHLIFGAAAFAKPERRGTLPAAMAGAFAPDFSLYAMVAISIWGLGIPAQTVFGEYYYSDAWQAVFAVDNSFILWGALLALAFWRSWWRLTAFAGAGFLHLCFDFPLHTHDARRHFWPVSDWVFESPVSYWDGSAHAGVVGPVTLGIVLVAVVYLFSQFTSLRARLAFLALSAAEIFSSGVWRFVF